MSKQYFLVTLLLVVASSVGYCQVEEFSKHSNQLRNEFSQFLNQSIATRTIKRILIAEEKPEADEDVHLKKKPGTPEFWFFVGASAGLTLFAGLMSGLTVGYLSIDELVLELKISNGTDDERTQAEAILQILERHHLLLVTLLMANAAAMEALPLFLDQLVSEVAAVLISVTAVLIFGEILPQAICTGPSQIKIAYYSSPLISLLMFVEGIIAFPIAKILDCLFGHHTKNRYKNTDLKGLIELHSQKAIEEIKASKGERSVGLNSQQTEIISGTIELAKITVKDAMKEYDSVATIDYKEKITEEFLLKLQGLGYSRFPVYRNGKHDVIGVLLVKKLLGIDEFGKTLEELGIAIRPPLIVRPDKPLLELLMEFPKGRSHIALVTEQTVELRKQCGYDVKDLGEEESPAFEEFMNNKAITIDGIITLEDVIEKALGKDILDEDDYDTEHNIYTNIQQIDSQRNIAKKIKLAERKENIRKMLSQVTRFEGMKRTGTKKQLVPEEKTEVIRSITGINVDTARKEHAMALAMLPEEQKKAPRNFP